MNTDEKHNENETRMHEIKGLPGNREERRRQAKQIARSNHIPFQTVNHILNKKGKGPVKV